MGVVRWMLDDVRWTSEFWQGRSWPMLLCCRTEIHLRPTEPLRTDDMPMPGQLVKPCWAKTCFGKVGGMLGQSGTCMASNLTLKKCRFSSAVWKGSTCCGNLRLSHCSAKMVPLCAVVVGTTLFVQCLSRDCRLCCWTCCQFLLGPFSLVARCCPCIQSWC